MRMLNPVRKKDLAPWVRREMGEWYESTAGREWKGWQLEEMIIDLTEKAWRMGYDCAEVDHTPAEEPEQ